MNCVLCRIMVIVFLVNCLAPNYGWGQTGRSSSKKSLESQLKHKVTAAQQKNSPAAQFEQADKLVRSLHNEWFAQADRNPKKIIPVPQPQKRAAQRLQAMPLLPQDNTYTSSRAFSNPGVDQAGKYVQGFLNTVGSEKTAEEVLALQGQTSVPPPPEGFAQKPDVISASPVAKKLEDFPELSQEAIAPSPQAFSTLVDHHNNHAQEFLKKIANNELDFKDALEYADPMDPDLAVNDLPTIAYAAEILGNSITEFEQIDTSLYDMKDLLDFLPHVEARLLHRLALLGHISPSYSLNETETPASISRSLLEASYKPSIAKTEAVGTLRITLLKIHRFYQKQNLPDPAEEYQKQMLAKQMKENFLKFTTKSEAERSGSLTANAPNTTRDQQFVQRAVHTTRRFGNIPSFHQNFLTELRQLRAQNPEEGSLAFQHLQILAEYATTYALEYDPTKLKEIVAVLDEGPDKTDFKQTYAPIINAIFVTILENTRDSNMGEAALKQILPLLEEFSDPQKYSLPTRVCALEVASFFFRPLNNLVNINKPEKTLRLTFAQRTADIYCPVTSEVANQAHLTLKKTLRSETFVDETAMNNYALSPNGMPTAPTYLALKKAFSSGPSNETVMQTYGLSLEEMQAFADKLAYIYDGFFDIHTTFIKDPKVGPANLGRENHPATQCHIVLRNLPNPLKRTSEAAAEIFSFTVTALFFAYVGPAFSAIGTAFRLTRGAVVALPRAATAYRVAKNGSKLKSFYETVKDGSQFANAVYKNKNQGRFMKLIVKENNPGVAAAEEAQSPVKLVTVNHTYELENKFSHWNPNRLFGSRPDQEVVGMQVVHVQPQGTVVAQAKFANGEFADGIHSMSQLKDAWSRLRLVTDPAKPMPYETQPYFSAMLDFQQAQMEQSLAAGLEASFKNSMDVWIPISNLPPAKIIKTPFKTFEIPWTAEEIAANTKWWNTRWGNPYQIAQSDMPAFISPRYRALPKKPVPGGIDLPANLPGFTTTMERVTTGEWRLNALNAFFKPMPWATNPTQMLPGLGTEAAEAASAGNWLHKTGLKLGHFFLPDYLPTKLFWETFKASPLFAVRMGPYFFLTQRWTLSAIGLGLWEGSDYLAYPFFRAWLEYETQNDTQKEINKYWDTFSPERTAEENLLMRKAGILPTLNEPTSTYQDVPQAKREESSGTLLSIPLVLTQRILGQIPGLSWLYIDFVNPAHQAAYAHKAFEKDLRYARLQQAQNKSDEEEIPSGSGVSLKEQADMLYNKTLADLAFGFTKVPHAKKQLRDLFDKHIRDFTAADSEEAKRQINAELLQQQNKILLPVDRWQKTRESYLAEVHTLRSTYAEDNRFLTPEVEEIIWNIYEVYVREYVNTFSLTHDLLKQRQKQYELEQQFQYNIKTIRTDLSDRWKVQYPLAGYKQELKLHERGLAALPQYKEPLKDLIARFSADMNTAQTDEQRLSICSQFHEQYDELMTPVTSWEKTAKEGEETIASAHTTFPDLVTPAMETQFRAIYEEYATEYVNRVLTLPEEKRQEKDNELVQNKDKKLGVIWNVLSHRWTAKYPQKSYKSLLNLYPDGFAAFPQYQKQLQQLYTRFAADMKAVKTEQAEAALIRDFEQNTEKLSAPVKEWNDLISRRDTTLTKIKSQYEDLVTPAIEQQVSQIYEEHLNAYIRSVLPLPREQRKDKKTLLEKQREKKLKALINSLELKWRIAHPLPLRQAVRSIQVYNDEPEYGTQWNAHIGQQ